MRTDYLKISIPGTIHRFFLAWMLCSIISGLFSGCTPADNEDGKDKEENYDISFPQTDTPAPVFSSQGGTDKVSFTATADWTATVMETRAGSWCSVEPLSGKAGNVTLSVTTEPNDTPDDREAVITLLCGTKKIEFKVMQKQKDALTTTDSTFEVDENGDEIEIVIKANITFECTVEEDAASWITPIEPKVTTRGLVETSMLFAVAPNFEMKSREGRIIVSSGDLSEVITVTQAAAKPVEISNEQEVDLGLSVVWASWNVGASKPEEVGNYYAWGETATKNAYYINSYARGNDYTDGKEIHLDASHDAATANWGNKWRMPTEEEIMELKRSEKLQLRKYTHNGVEGLLYVSTNGKSIFFPYTGWRDYSSDVQNKDHMGFWSNEADVDNTEKAYSFYSDPSNTIFDGIGTVLATTSLRCNGLTVRAVRRPDVQFTDFRAENITETSADVSYAVSLDGTPVENITEIGFQLSSSPEITYHSQKEVITVTLQDGTISTRVQNLNSATTYFLRPFMRSKKDGTYYGEVQQITTEGSLSEGQWIDMGLSVKWASYNIGAAGPTEKGSLFGWAEIEPRANDTFFDITMARFYSYKETVKFIHSPNSNLSQSDVIHHFSKYGEDGRMTLEAEDDAASVIWGDGARTPTREEWQELMDNTTWQKAVVSGVEGWRFNSTKNNNSIFLPAVDYWTATLQEETVNSYRQNSDEIIKTYYRYDGAYYWDDVAGKFYGGGRNYHNYIRPVQD
ncbi:MAG: BACON domain-containing protein [Candidatus Cryptobacteroides sp.]